LGTSLKEPGKTAKKMVFRRGKPLKNKQTRGYLHSVESGEGSKNLNWGRSTGKLKRHENKGKQMYGRLSIKANLKKFQGERGGGCLLMGRACNQKVRGRCPSTSET